MMASQCEDYELHPEIVEMLEKQNPSEMGLRLLEE